ncbi:hypothetical protein DYB32_002225 [Aphanomyces invadans]|uniref:Uncharacterized protein n=1 Tax=Aphanomyces invadans TaxID=157072 RepID=A0A3R6VEY0_9STRA|nr:hypothetical protein DYB32_002225 [Aphanomyces invadans]
MPKVAFSKGSHGTKTSASLRGTDLLLALCATDEQRQVVVELVEKNNPLGLELALTGSFDATAKKFNLTKAVFLTDAQLLVHNFVELIELRLEDPESAAESLSLLLTENGHSDADVHIAEECLTIAYALQTLLRAFPSIPLAIHGQAVEINASTDVADIFGALFAPKKVKKASDKKTATAAFAQTPKKRKNKA